MNWIVFEQKLIFEIVKYAKNRNATSKETLDIEARRGIRDKEIEWSVE